MRSQSKNIAPIDLVAVRGFVARWQLSGGADRVVDTLDEGEQADITTLLWIASGLYSPSEINEARFEADAALSPATTQRLIATPKLAERIEAGIARISAPIRLH